MNLEVNKVHLGNAIHLLKLIEPKSVNTCVSSPPYYALRDYGIEPTIFPAIIYTMFGFKIKVKPMTVCLGLEPTPQDFIGHLIYIYRLVREGLADDGTIWVNMGDSYSAAKKKRTDEQAVRKSNLNGGKGTQLSCVNQQSKIFTGTGIKAKDMLGIPWMLAFALREDGWYLRQDIIWHKKNCMPESCRDRCTKNHEYIFLLSKSNKYYFDNEAIKTISLGDNRSIGGWADSGDHSALAWANEKGQGRGRSPREGVDVRGGNQGNGNIPKINKRDTEVTGYANKRSVWTIATQGFSEAHFATFPEKLIEDCIKAGTSEYGHCKCCGKPYYRIIESELVRGPKSPKASTVTLRAAEADTLNAGSNRLKDGHVSGCVKTSNTTGWQKSCKCDTTEIRPGRVLDMFSGSGTTAIVSVKLHRDFYAIEQNPKYVVISDKRMHKELGLFNPNNTFLKVS